MIDCANHPSIPAAAVCATCGRPYCEQCLVEVLGQRQCGPCRDRQLAVMQGYAPDPAARPPVWRWYVAFCVLMALMYLAVGALGGVFLAFADQMGPEMSPLEARIQGGIMLGLGLLFTIPYAIAPFLPRARWTWVYHLVLIGFCMSSCACIPIGLPLLLFWTKPETRAWFGYA